MAATLLDVAKAVGKSVQLVSAVLHGGRSSSAASAATRKRILEAARALGYMPNAAARAVSTGRFGAVGLLLSTASWKSSLPELTLNGIRTALAERDLHLSLGWFPDEKLTAAGYIPKLLREMMADGLLIKYDSSIPARMVELVRGSGLPAIWLNSQQEYDCVYPDDFGAAKDITRRFIELGHRRIAYLDFHPRPVSDHYSSEARWGGYEEVMKDAGLSPWHLNEKHPVPKEERLAFVLRVLSRPDRPTAVLTYGDLDALPILHAAALAGLRVPQELSIATFGGRPNDDTGVKITTALIPEEELGKVSVEMLLQKIARPKVKLRPRRLEFGFDEGSTCAPPPARVGG